MMANDGKEYRERLVKVFALMLELPYNKNVVVSELAKIYGVECEEMINKRLEAFAKLVHDVYRSEFQDVENGMSMADGLFQEFNENTED